MAIIVSPETTFGSQLRFWSSEPYASRYGTIMSECKGKAGPVAPTFASSSLTTTLCKKSPPGPPYSSGTVQQSSPFSPAAVQSSLLTMPCCSQSAWFGTILFSIKRRVASRNISCSSEKNFLVNICFPWDWFVNLFIKS